jgi:hypothetical protein
MYSERMERAFGFCVAAEHQQLPTTTLLYLRRASSAERDRASKGAGVCCCRAVVAYSLCIKRSSVLVSSRHFPAVPPSVLDDRLRRGTSTTGTPIGECHCPHGLMLGKTTRRVQDAVYAVEVKCVTCMRACIYADVAGFCATHHVKMELGKLVASFSLQTSRGR